MNGEKSASAILWPVNCIIISDAYRKDIDNLTGSVYNRAQLKRFCEPFVYFGGLNGSPG
jgi:hypothetical protein